MPTSNRIILTDVDGVLLEWERHFTDWMLQRSYYNANEERIYPYKLLPNKQNTYEMAERDVLLGPMFKKIWDSDDKLYNFYLNDEDMDENNPYVVPYVGNYDDCPPIMIQVGTEECLLSDSIRLRDKLELDGCEHEYYEWEGMYHVFHIDVRIPETIQAFNQIGDFLKKYIGVKI